jgi:hypothetical protein
VGVVTFFALTMAAIVLRRRAGWHKRLMLCGTIVVMSPALGRLLPMPFLGPLAPWAVFGSMLLYVAAGMVFDRVTRGRVHPAYLWGAGTIIITQLLIGALAFSPPILAVTAAITSG